MIKHWLSILTVLFLVITVAQAQTDDRTLFSVDGKPVTVDEFTYIYSKTNGDKADFSEATLQEYLDLYVKFKLKVARAMEMQLDTIPSLQQELAGYRRQLADSYLIDRTVTDQLVQQAYDRIQQDVEISHILVALPKNPAPEDTLAALQKAENILAGIKNQADFVAAAKTSSDDRFTKEREGKVGYITALFPNGLHRLENAAYEGKMGTALGPVRSTAGYHVLWVHQRRPARGEMEAAHILLRKNEKDPAAVKARIDSIYQALQAGADFDQMARQLSEDKSTAPNAGNLGFFGINKFDIAFENAAFGLKQDGAFSQPVETAAGWHIIKRISRRGVQPFDIEKARLEQKIRQDSRFEDAKADMLKRIRRESNYRANEQVLTDFIASLTDTFVTFRWRAPENPSSEVLFTLGEDYPVTLGMFTGYLGRASRARTMAARSGSLESAARDLYEQFVNDQLLKYEETQLENKYPEFKALMREYEEGILLFEATKIEVWDKAGQDTIGLEQFFKTIEGKYRWPERAKGTMYQIGLSQRGQLPMIQDYAKTHSKEQVLERFNTADRIVVTAESATLEQGRIPGKVDWAVGAVSEGKENKRSKSLTFFKIEELLPVSNKNLNEARGYIVADYQDELERRWVAQLRKDYSIEINDKVFRSLIKKK